MRPNTILVCVALAAAMILGGCDNSPVNSGVEERIDAATLASRMTVRSDLPREALHLSANDIVPLYKERYGAPSAIVREGGDVLIPVASAELTSVVKSVVAQYPDFERVSPADLNRISRDFGGLSERSVVANLGTIRDLYEAQMRYEVFRTVSRGGTRTPPPQIATASYAGVSLNNREKALIAQYPSLIACMERAVAQTNAYQGKYLASRRISGDDNTRGNSYRHTMWNVMIGKECGWYFSTIDKAVWWIKAFTDAHEYGDPDPPSHPLEVPMDIHNNARGQEIFRYYAFTEFKYGLRRVGWQDATFAHSLVTSKADRAVFFNRADQLRNLTGSLVFAVGR